MVKYIQPFPSSIKSEGRRPSGRYAHENHIESRYAIDFPLPIGTPIIASRRGVVVFVKQDSDRFISEPEKMGSMSMKELIDFSEKYTNLLCIEHGDGTFAEYAHLDRQTVVKEGQEVEQGQTIGYCGMSGLTTEPHLHFNVFKVKDDKAESIPVEFT